MRMRYEEGEGVSAVIVTLSRRNLLGLLHKLDMEGSARTLVKHGEGNGGHDVLVVQCEDDKDHYATRPEGPPGPMHPLSEAYALAHSHEDGSGI